MKTGLTQVSFALMGIQRIQSPCSSMASSSQQNKAFLVLSPPHADQSVIWCERTRDIPLRNLITIGIEAHLSVKNDTAFDSDFWPGGGRLFFWTGMCHMWGARDSLEALKPHHKSDKGKDVISLVFSSKKPPAVSKSHQKHWSSPRLGGSRGSMGPSLCYWIPQGVYPC